MGREYLWYDVYGAPYMLAECYFYGRGVDQDYKEAVKWYEKTLDVHEECSIYLGCAQYKLGVCYENGYGVAMSKEDALSYYESALYLGVGDVEEELELEKAYKRLAGKDFEWHGTIMVERK